MVTIKCINPECKAPNRKFKWDETKYGSGLAEPHAPGAVRVTAFCTTCGTENPVWVRDVKKTETITRGGKRR